MIQVKKVHKKYGDSVVLNNVSLSIGSGMNFVVGSSGSGKTSLFKIMAGIDHEYEGEVLLCNKNINTLSPLEKSSLYNTTIGFIWQEFNLIENYTVLNNVLLATQLSNHVDKKRARELITELGLKHLVDKQVRFLSGGQKQRVAIARELMKNPQIILADEPTSALDKQAANDIMKILRNIANDSTVIVITHDTSYITEEDSVFELDKGELIFENTHVVEANTNKLTIHKTTFPIRNACSIMKTTIGCHKGRFLASIVSLLISACFLLTMFGDSMTSASQSEFNKLFNLYGESVLDISLVHSFTGAAGTTEKDNENPNVDVKQSLKGLFELYKNNKRVDFITYIKALDNITVRDGDKSYPVEASGNVPVIKKLIAGRLANGSKKEVVVPESFVKEMNISNKEALGKKISFDAEIVEWNENKPTIRKVSTEAEIVGIIDASIVTVFEGKKYEYPIHDSFFFSKSALDELLKDCTRKSDNMDILIRAKTTKDLISLKDELNKKGLVPIGNFEVIEDLVRLSSQSEKQTKIASELIVALAIVMVAAVSLITSMLRKKEYAIFKISGFSNQNLRVLNFVEACIQFVCSFVLIMLLAPVINMISEKIIGIQIVSFKNVGIHLLIFIGITMLSYIITEIICETVSIIKIFKAEER